MLQDTPENHSTNIMQKICDKIKALKGWFSSLWTKQKGDEKKDDLFLLSPVVDENAYSVYVSKLMAAIDNESVHNIAVSGSYGSGKSSMLETFRRRYPKCKIINVTATSFEEKNPEDEHSLELSILQELFYQVKATEIPESKFERIGKVSICNTIITSVGLLLFVIISIGMFSDGVLSNLLDFLRISETSCISQFLYDCSWLRWLLFIIWFLLLFCIIYYVVKILSKVRIHKLSYSGSSVELGDWNKISNLNKYLDEIVYLFSQEDYQVVIFEDIDRFENIQIFTKLRELNILLNRSADISRRIVFVYAIRDDLLNKPELRTKFFDYIIPVIPYINISNSATLFRTRLDALEITEEKLPSDFIKDISMFVSDMRILTNVVNEFDVYRQVLKQELELTHLLAIILYKNLYPADYIALNKNEGFVYDVFKNSETIKGKRFQKLNKELRELQKQVEDAQEEKLQSLKELNSVVVGAFLKKVKNYSSIRQKGKAGNIAIDKLFSDEYVGLIIQGKMGSAVSSTTYVSTNDLMSELGPEFNYNKRKNDIERKEENKIRELQEKIRKNKELQSNAQSIRLHDLCEEGEDVFNGITKEKDVDYKTVESLLSRGYINEDYSSYITLYHERDLKEKDYEYILRLKDSKKNDLLSYELDSAENVCNHLSNIDFKSVGIVNIKMLDYCLKNMPERADSIIECMLKHKSFIGIKAIYEFIKKGTNKDEFAKQLAKQYVDLMSDMSYDQEHTDEEKDNLISLIFKNADIEDIKKIDVRDSFIRYINPKKDYVKLFEELDKDRIESLISLMELLVENLVDDSKEGKDTYSVIFKQRKYALNIPNISTILQHEGVDVEGIEKAPYSKVMKSGIEQLKSNVNNDINRFTKDIIVGKSCTQEEEEYFIQLLNNKEIEVLAKGFLIKDYDLQVSKLSDIENPTLAEQAFETGKCKVTWDNIKYYASNIMTTEKEKKLFAYIHDNADSVATVVSNMNSIDETEKQLLAKIVSDTKTEEKVALAIIDNPNLEDVWNDVTILEKLNNSIHEHILSNNRLQMTPELFEKVYRNRMPELGNVIHQYYHDAIISKLPQYRLGFSKKMKMLAMPIYNQNIREIIDSININELKTSKDCDVLLVYLNRKGITCPESVYMKTMEDGRILSAKINATIRKMKDKQLTKEQLLKVLPLISPSIEVEGSKVTIPTGLEGADKLVNAMLLLPYTSNLDASPNLYVLEVGQD